MAASAVETKSPQPLGNDLSLQIEGMTCASCVSRVERVLSRVEGVTDVRVNLATERADLHAAASVTRQALVDAVERAGYGVAPEVESSGGSARASAEAQSEKERTAARKAILAAVLSLPVFALEMGAHLIPSVHHWVLHNVGEEPSWLLQLLLTTLVLALPGRELLGHGIKALFRLAPDMNSLVALGTLSAYGYSLVSTAARSWLPEGTRSIYYEAASVVISLILFGRYLEAKAKGRTGQAIAQLVALSPDVAVVQRQGEWVELNTREVRKGDLLLVRPGARVAVDGVVVEGNSHVDESMLTGEPLPVHKTQDSPLHAGTVNQLGSLTQRATAVGTHTLLSQIVRMVQSAQATKLPIQALVDRVTAWFVPVVLGLAALTFGLWLWLGPEPSLSLALVNAVSVLIIACPCAMGLATPTSILVGTGKGAELGLLFRHGEALQRLQEAKVIALDKTGTLTMGHPELIATHWSAGFEQAKGMAYVGAVESRSQHPVAQALVRAASDDVSKVGEVVDFETLVGKGVRAVVDGHRIAVGAPRWFEELEIALGTLSEHVDAAEREGKTVLLAAIDGVIAAVFAVSDPVRPAARATVRALQGMNIQVALITGDNRTTAQSVARELGIEEVVAQVLPAGKVDALRELRTRYGAVAFVGDGINDAPVLAEADVGIAMGTGTDIAIEAADVVIVRSDLMTLPTAIALSRATLRNIRQNLFWAFAYNAALIPLAAGALYPVFGLLLSPMLGGLAMALSSVFVVGNALRLKRFKAVTSEQTAPITLGVNA